MTFVRLLAFCVCIHESECDWTMRRFGGDALDLLDVCIVVNSLRNGHAFGIVAIYEFTFRTMSKTRDDCVCEQLPVPDCANLLSAPVIHIDESDVQHGRQREYPQLHCVSS